MVLSIVLIIISHVIIDIEHFFMSLGVIGFSFSVTCFHIIHFSLRLLGGFCFVYFLGVLKILEKLAFYLLY